MGASCGADCGPPVSHKDGTGCVGWSFRVRKNKNKKRFEQE